MNVSHPERRPADGSGSGISFTGSILLIVYVFVADASLGFAGEAHSGGVIIVRQLKFCTWFCTMFNFTSLHFTSSPKASSGERVLRLA